MKRFLVTITLALIVVIILTRPDQVSAACQEFILTPSGTITTSTNITIVARGCVAGATYTGELQRQGGATVPLVFTALPAQNQYSVTFGPLQAGTYAAILRENGVITNDRLFTVSASSGGGGPSGGTVVTQNPLGKEDCSAQELYTAIGCIPINDFNSMAGFFLSWALGIAGGVALLMIALAGYRIATSQGDPRRLQGGQELLLSAIGGLVMIVLSVYLLRFIGVDLLGIF